MHTKNTHGGVWVQLHSFVTSALDGVRGQLQKPTDLLPGRSPWQPLNGRPEGEGPKLVSCPCWETKPQVLNNPARGPVTLRTELLYAVTEQVKIMSDAD